MRDLIDRQAAIDAAEKESQVDGAYGYMDTKSIVDLLNNLPAAQPEVIRYKDCKYYKTKFCALDTWTNEITIYKAQPDDYCSKAERRTDD